MQREELMDMFERIPVLDYAKVQLVMRSGNMLSIDTLVRFEPTYFVIRGREAGNQDEGRGFFLPYDDIEYLKIERTMSLVELDHMFRDKPVNVKRGGTTGKDTRSDSVHETPRPEQPTAPMDPAEIAKQNLLERIRAAKSVGTTPRTQLTK
jgi:hypothetical protein